MVCVGRSQSCFTRNDWFGDARVGARRSRRRRRVRGLVRRADVPEGEEVGDLVVFHGSATVDGTVNGSLTAFDAPVTISGQVNGDVVVFNGRVELREGATVTGDVVSRASQ